MRGLLLMLAAIGSVWLAGWVWQVVSLFSDVLLLFFLAWLLAFVLNPIARRLKRMGVPRIASVAFVYALLAVVLVTIALLLVPAVANQTVQLALSLPALADELQTRADQLHAALIQRGLPEAQLSEFYRNAITRAEQIGTTALSNSLTIATTVVGAFVRGSLILIISFYIMLDGDKIGRLLVTLMPERYRPGMAAALDQIDRTFGGFVRGQIVQAMIYSLGTWIVMQLAQLPYSLVLSAFAGVAMAIPIIGPYLAMGPPLILAVIVSPDRVWWVLVLLFILQFIVVNVLAPRILSQQVGIHPLLVFAAVLIGAQIGGGWGAIFGVPIAAMLLLLARLFYQRVILDMPLYRTGARLSVEAIAPVREEDPPPSSPLSTGPERSPSANAAQAVHATEAGE